MTAKQFISVVGLALAVACGVIGCGGGSAKPSEKEISSAFEQEWNAWTSSRREAMKANLASHQDDMRVIAGGGVDHILDATWNEESGKLNAWKPKVREEFGQRAEGYFAMKRRLEEEQVSDAGAERTEWFQRLIEEVTDIQPVKDMTRG